MMLWRDCCSKTASGQQSSGRKVCTPAGPILHCLSVWSPVSYTHLQQKELEQQVAEAEEEARAREQAQAEAEKVAKEAEKSEETEELADAEKTQEAASGSASRDKAGEAAADAAGETAGTEGTGMADGAELELSLIHISRRWTRQEAGSIL